MKQKPKRHGLTLYRTQRWKALRQEVLRRDDYKCVKCGKRGRLEVDHVKPLRDGGAPWDTRNLQSLCGSCHAKKTRRDMGLPPPNPELVKWRRAVKELCK